jgi:hypothetical protein
MFAAFAFQFSQNARLRFGWRFVSEVDMIRAAGQAAVPIFADHPNRHSQLGLVVVVFLAVAIGTCGSACGKLNKPDDATITTNIKAKMFSGGR